MSTKNIGEYRILPAKTEVWSISLQSMISFKDEQIIELTNGVYTDDNYYFAKLKIIYGIGLQIPGIGDRPNGEIGLNIKGLKKYKLPKPQFLEFSYNNIPDPPTPPKDVFLKEGAEPVKPRSHK